MLKNHLLKGCTFAASLMLILICISPLQADEKKAEKDTANSKVQEIEEMVVEDEARAQGYKTTPSQTTIELEDITFIGEPTYILDAIKINAMVDFRGASDLDPGVDSVYLNGFSAKRFVTAMDDVTIQKTGGRKSSNIVDWAQLPGFLLESVEILPGPHSALFDAKSIGGVINMKTKTPKAYDTRVPELTYTTGYRSYDTFSNTAVIQGGVEKFIYDIAYQNYMTDGYLRNNETETNIGFGRLGFILPGDGYITFSASLSDIDRNSPVNNPGTTKDDAIDFDSSYPEVTGSVWDPWQNPTWDSTAETYRFNYAQTLGINRLSAGAYYGEETRDRAYLDWVDNKDKSKGTVLSSMETDWWQQGGKITDEIKWAGGETTVGVDFTQLFDEGVDDSKTERVRKKGAFVQHKFGIIPHVDMTLGLRYEDVNTWVSNWSNGKPHNAYYDKYVKRDFDQIIPKSMTTWHMDHLGACFRDTTLSAGISKIWHAPDYHGDYNPQGRPAGITLEPEHGVGYDLILNRRLWGNINLKAGYAFYDIKDFIATNSSYAKYSSADAGALRYSDYKINLDEVYRHGTTLELSGNVTPELSFYLSWAWQKFENQGDEPAGETELDQRAEHQVGIGLRYAFNEKATLMLDYTYQSDETTEISEEIADDVWNFRQVDIPAHSVVDIGVEYKCFEQLGWLKNGTLNVYVKNLLDEDYYDSTGYPATDRTFGITFSIKI
nr:TonB-dependent receptor [Desulfobacter hydrogenophilus]